MKRSTTLASFVLFGALSSGAVWLMRQHGAAPPSPATATSSKSDGARSASFSRAGWEVGTEYVHRLEYHVTLGQDAEQPQPGRGLDLTARGELRSRVYEASQERVKVRYELAAAKLESPLANAEDSSGKQATERALAQPFGVEYDTRGRALQLFVQPGLDSIALGIVRELISTAQLSLPELRAARWSALENDAAGEYQADYTQQSSLAVQRQKLTYARIPGPDGLKRVAGGGPKIRSALAKFRLDDWGRAAELESHFEVTTPPALDGGGPLFVANTDVRLRFVSRAKVGDTAPPDLAGLQATSLSPDARDFARAASDSDRALVGDATPQQLLRELEKLEPDDNQAASSVQVRMSALVRQQPSAVAPLMSRLNAKNAPTVLGALGSAGTPEAQKALADVTRDEHREGSVRQAAIDSMLTLEHPTNDVPEALRVAMASGDPALRNNSSLMLGVMSRRLAEEEPEKAAALNEKLATELAATSDTTEQLRLLGSLGNSGGTEGLSQIALALKSPDPAVRAQAASSLRFVEDPQADALLSEVMITDPTAIVRSAALGAAGFRNYEPLAAALERATKDPEQSLRLQLVTVLTGLAADSGDALVLLDRMAQTDPSKEVQDLAKRTLERAGATAQNR
jgi:hypothetical protein